jgi:WhiB family redox-sensing transcriptional regulator
MGAMSMHQLGARIPRTFLQLGDRPACQGEGVDPEWFFPHRADSKKYAKKAKEVCRRCDLTERCADWAAKAGVRYGVWGALSSKQLDRRRCRSGLCKHPNHRTVAA